MEEEGCQIIQMNQHITLRLHRSGNVEGEIGCWLHATLHNTKHNETETFPVYLIQEGCANNS